MPDEFPPTADHPDDARLPSDSQSTDADEPSRRSFLASVGSASAGLAATAGLGATAGCVQVLPAMGQQIRFDDVALPEPASPRYREWIPAPEAVDFEGHLDPEFVAIPNSDVEAVTGVRAEYGRGFMAGVIDYFGVGFGNYDLAVGLWGDPNQVHVLEGPIAPAEVGTVVRDSGYEADGQHRGYDRYVRDDIPRTVAVTDGRILFGKGPQRDEAIETVLDARAGDVPRLVEDSAFEEVTDAAGTRPFLMLTNGFSGIFDEYEMERIVVGTDFDESAFYYFHYIRFVDDVPSRGEIQDEIESMDMGEEADAVDVERDGQFVSLVFEMASDVVQSEFVSSGVPPHCTWGIDAESDGYRIRHEVGEAVPAAELSVRDRSLGERELDVQFDDEYATVGPDDSLFVPADAIEEGPIVLVWEGEDATSVLLEYSP